MSMILIVEGLVKYFDSRAVLSDISWAIEIPGIYSLLGPNGAGKSTLLSILAGIVEPDRGRVLIKGLNPANPFTRRIIGYCPQEPGLVDHLSGYDNTVFYGRLYGLSGREILERTKDLASRLGLSDRELRMRVGKYSGGMKKKLALITSMLHDPEILILDEPTTGLDPNVRRDVWNLLIELKNSSKTVILATHNMEEADALSNRVAIIDRGRIIAEDSPDKLKEKYGPKTVVQLKFSRELDRGALSIVEKYTSRHYTDKDIARLHLDDPQTHLPTLIGELYSNGYSIVEFKLITPTLEDVFLKLTGKRLEEQ